MAFLIVFLGAGLGGALRHAVNQAALSLGVGNFPVATLFINVTGSFIMGLAAEYWALKSGLSQPMRLFLTTGVLGGYTTFSTFSLDTALLWERGQPLSAAGYALASVLLGVAALFLALFIVRTLVVRG